jgi:hypothetical protein
MAREPFDRFNAVNEKAAPRAANAEDYAPSDSATLA